MTLVVHTQWCGGKIHDEKLWLRNLVYKCTYNATFCASSAEDIIYIQHSEGGGIPMSDLQTSLDGEKLYRFQSIPFSGKRCHVGSSRPVYIIKGETPGVAIPLKNNAMSRFHACNVPLAFEPFLSCVSIFVPIGQRSGDRSCHAG
jgi:hypothetical protein